MSGKRTCPRFEVGSYHWAISSSTRDTQSLMLTARFLLQIYHAWSRDRTTVCQADVLTTTPPCLSCLWFTIHVWWFLWAYSAWNKNYSILFIRLNMYEVFTFSLCLRLSTEDVDSIAALDALLSLSDCCCNRVNVCSNRDPSYSGRRRLESVKFGNFKKQTQEILGH